MRINRLPGVRLTSVTAFAATAAALATCALAKDDPAPKPAEKPAATPAGKPADPAAEMAEWAKANAPGPQHAQLAKMAGDWDAAITLFNPDGPKVESKGKQKATVVLGGRFLDEQFEGSMMGMPFTGRGFTGYDNLRKTWVSTWADSMSTGIMVFQGPADPAGKVIEMHAEQKVADGKVERWRSVTTFVDDNTHTFDMFATMPDGKERQVMSIKYTRAAAAK